MWLEGTERARTDLRGPWLVRSAFGSTFSKKVENRKEKKQPRNTPNKHQPNKPTQTTIKKNS